MRVLKGHPAVYELEGQKRGHAATVVTLGRRPPGAADDPAVVAAGRPAAAPGRSSRWPSATSRTARTGSLLDKQDDGTYLINGEVAEAGADSLVLTLRDRDVTVHLRGHANPVDVGDRAKVHAHLVG